MFAIIFFAHRSKRVLIHFLIYGKLVYMLLLLLPPNVLCTCLCHLNSNTWLRLLRFKFLFIQTIFVCWPFRICRAEIKPSQVWLSTIFHVSFVVVYFFFLPPSNVQTRTHAHTYTQIQYSCMVMIRMAFHSAGRRQVSQSNINTHSHAHTWYDKNNDIETIVIKYLTLCRQLMYIRLGITRFH